MNHDWLTLQNIMSELFREQNTGAGLRNPREIWDRYGTTLASIADPAVREGLTEIGRGVWALRAYEALRPLRFLKQRMGPAHAGRPLVDQIRAEAVVRQRPVRDVSTDNLPAGTPQRIMAGIGGKPTYSKFQVSGWINILDTIQNRKSIVIVGSTGSGKTETFLLPIIYTIARKLQENVEPPRFILVYPRVELLKDQVSRILKYAYHAGRAFNGRNMMGEDIVVGLQYGGIGSTYQRTVDIGKVLDSEGRFLTVPTCPICEAPQSYLHVARKREKLAYLECTNCKRVFPATLSREALEAVRPHLLVTNVESLERLYLNPMVEDYLRNIEGLVFDEVHLYHSLYGAHVSSLIQHVERSQTHSKPLTKIASSATVANPQRFVSRLFHGRDNVPVDEHNGAGYPQERVGLETVVFLQAPDEQPAAPVQSTLIQTVMGLWHGILEEGNRAIVFTESVDHAGRSFRQINDAENNKRLWRFRTITSELMYQGHPCPATSPMVCNDLYMNGECWRGIRGGIDCAVSANVNERALEPSVITSMDHNEYWQGDIVVATSALEVGVDDERFVATVHYRPPMSVFSFLQRRGRAGRRPGEIAYTILVLGRTPTDEFYFRRRNRLMDGANFELPLNPQNQVISLMHKRIEAERENLGELYTRHGLPKAIMLWVLQRYQQCSTLQRIFGKELSAMHYAVSLAARNQMAVQQNAFKTWVANQYRRFEQHLNIEVLLEELVARVPATEREAATRFQEMLRLYRRGDTNQSPHIQNLAKQIGRVLVERIIDAEDDVERLLYERMQKLVTDAARGVRLVEQLDVTERQISALYDFFAHLNSLNGDDRAYVLMYAPDALKLVLQSLFYIGNACLEEHPDCSACVDFYVPGAYFQEVKPILVETRTASQDPQLRRIYAEDSTRLTSLLVPYKPFYRYYSDVDDMAVIHTTHNPNWVTTQGNQTVVRIGLGVEGIRHHDGINPRKVYVRSVRPDDNGHGVVRLCKHCFAVYSEDRPRNCECGHQISVVKLYAEPLVQREALGINDIQISEMFRYCGQMEGSTRIEGAAVRYVDQLWDGTKYIGTRDGQFVALYYRNGETPEPLIYSINTRGIVWDLRQIVSVLSQDQALGRKMQDTHGKQLTPELILHTAAHMLHRGVATLSGVKEQAIEYAIVPESLRVVIWERYEGGAGISEIVRDVLMERPVDFYRELLASALCPVYLSEQPDWSGEDALRASLAERWALGEDDLLIDAIVRETAAERRATAEGAAERANTCSLNDGCPACIHVTICTAHHEQHNRVSREIAEAILNQIRQQVDIIQLEGINEYRLSHRLPPVGQLRANIRQGLYDVVRL